MMGNLQEQQPFVIGVSMGFVRISILKNELGGY